MAYVFKEFPKLLYHTDGRVTTVNNQSEQTSQLAIAGWSLTPSTATEGVYRISASTSAVTITSPDDKLKTLKLINDSSAKCWIKYGPSASSSDFTWPMDPGERIWMQTVIGPDGIERPEYSGLITARWESANGAMQVTKTRFP